MVRSSPPGISLIAYPHCTVSSPLGPSRPAHQHLQLVEDAIPGVLLASHCAQGSHLISGIANALQVCNQVRLRGQSRVVRVKGGVQVEAVAALVPPAANCNMAHMQHALDLTDLGVELVELRGLLRDVLLEDFIFLSLEVQVVGRSHSCRDIDTMGRAEMICETVVPSVVVQPVAALDMAAMVCDSSSSLTDPLCRVVSPHVSLLTQSIAQHGIADCAGAALVGVVGHDEELLFRG